MSDKKETLVLIDGHALAYRAYFGMPATFSTAEGEPTHAVYGFANMILAVWKEYEPDYFIVTFDRGDTFRHEMYDEYKATREKMPDDLRTQIERIEQMVTAFNMPVFTKEGYEADDLLGTLMLSFTGPVVLAPAMNSQMWENVAVQRNLQQLRSDGVHIVDPQEGWLSCRQKGVGRMAEPSEIKEVITRLLERGK